MKQIEATKALFDGGLGLSCLENYLLYIMAHLKFDCRILYAYSYITMSEIARAFFDEKITYAHFDKISRLQGITCDFGIIKLTSIDSIKEIDTCNGYCCIRVNSRFFEKHYVRESWRGDHYILLCNKLNDGYLILNDIPRAVIEMNSEQLLAVFDGNIFCFEFLMESIPNAIKAKLFTEFQSLLPRLNSAYEFKCNNIETARDFLGILRVTRRRIQEYCSIYFDSDFMSENITKIDKSYAMFEYMRLRNRFDYNKVNQSLSEIQENDFSMIDRLNQEMRTIQ